MRKLRLQIFGMRLLVALLVPALVIGFAQTPLQTAVSAYTYADVQDLQKQIDALRAKENELANRASQIAAETAGFEREKRQAENEIAVLVNEIQLSEVEIQKLAGEIAVNQRKIESTQSAIASTLVDLYLTQDVSLIERLASSKSFASFIDDSTKHTSSTDSLAASAASIKETKAELERQQAEIKAKQDNQKAKKQELDNRRSSLQRAINGNNAEQAQFAADRDAAVKQRKELSAKQSAIMWELAKDSIGSGNISSNKGGYPYQGDCPAKQDTYFDRWGMYVCECVSYGAWKVFQYYGINVKSIGRSGSYNGEFWPERLKGIVPMGSTPKAHSIASWDGGPYGHVAWVEYIDGSGNVWVSEYNVKPGNYSERNASKSAGWMNAKNATYIYFDQY
jgi:surface antigen